MNTCRGSGSSAHSKQARVRPRARLHSMWSSCLLLVLVAIDLDSSFGSTVAKPSGRARNRHLPVDELPFRDLSQQAAEAGRVVGDEIQQRLEPLERSDQNCWSSPLPCCAAMSAKLLMRHSSTQSNFRQLSFHEPKFKDLLVDPCQSLEILATLYTAVRKYDINL